MTANSAEQIGRHIRHRVRYLPGLPQYSPTDAAYSASPCFDRMEIRRAYRLTGLPAGMFDFPGELALAMRDDRLRPSRRLPYFEDFVGLSDYGDGRYDGTIGIRRNHLAGGRVWLVGVKIKFSARHSAEGIADEQHSIHAPPVHVSITSEVNPARIIAHAVKRGIDIETAAWHQLLTSDEATYRALCASSYNGADNIVPSEAFLQPVSELAWTRLAARCLDALDGLVHHLLVSSRSRDEQRLPSEPILRPDGSPHILSAEVYQEFRQADAADTVRQMLPVLRQTASELSHNLWTGEESRSPVASYTLRLTDQINLGIYAKSHDRVRMEVRYHTRVPSGGALPIEERLIALSRDASGRILSARRAIAAGQQHLGRPLILGEAIGRLSELSSELARFFGDVPMRHRRLLEALLTHGAVDAGPEKIITGDEARRLVRANVLDTTRIANRSKGGNRYSLAPRYVPLVALFQLAPNGE